MNTTTQSKPTTASSRLARLALATFVLSLGLGAGRLIGSLGEPETPAPLQAMWAENYLSLGEMADAADAVVLARAQQSYPGRVLQGPEGADLPFTLTDFEVVATVRGSVGELFTLERTGGEGLDGTLLALDDGGVYGQGELQLLFLREQPGTGLYIVPHPQARFSVDEGYRLHAVVADGPASGDLDGLSTDQAVKTIGLSLR